MRFLEKDDGRVVNDAAIELGKLGDERAVEPLIEVLGDESKMIGVNAARALGEIGDVRAVEPLIKALDDEYGEVCEYAARALGQIGDARAVEPLIKALGDHYGPPMGWFRRHAAAALEAIGGPRAMEVLEDVHWDDPEQFRIEGLIKALVNVDV
ncbi:MAG: HEAT repeat domain-containing protein, partial [Candidatus Poseidoniia archaeon]|nr:HEAT repeat domain-containing protein [Candidatus Poseidoniia archaeon]